MLLSIASIIGIICCSIWLGINFIANRLISDKLVAEKLKESLLAPKILYPFYFVLAIYSCILGFSAYCTTRGYFATRETKQLWEAYSGRQGRVSGQQQDSIGKLFQVSLKKDKFYKEYYRSSIFYSESERLPYLLEELDYEIVPQARQ